jgi:hypothetical protein
MGLWWNSSMGSRRALLRQYADEVIELAIFVAAPETGRDARKSLDLPRRKPWTGRFP